MPSFYEVIVGNVGKVYDGNNEQEAKEKFASYVEKSKSGRGRCSFECVSLWLDGDILTEYFPPDDSAEAFAMDNGFRG